MVMILRFLAGKFGVYALIAAALVVAGLVAALAFSRSEVANVKKERDDAFVLVGALRGDLRVCRDGRKTLQGAIDDNNRQVLEDANAAARLEANRQAEKAAIIAGNAKLARENANLAARLRSGSKSGVSQVTPEVWSKL